MLSGEEREELSRDSSGAAAARLTVEGGGADAPPRVRLVIELEWRSSAITRLVGLKSRLGFGESNQNERLVMGSVLTVNVTTPHAF